MSAKHLAKIGRRLRDSFACAARRAVADDPVGIRSRTSFFSGLDDRNGMSSSMSLKPPGLPEDFGAERAGQRTIDEAASAQRFELRVAEQSVTS
jgi:hypothetical protein